MHIFTLPLQIHHTRVHPVEWRHCPRQSPMQGLSALTRPAMKWFWWKYYKYYTHSCWVQLDRCLATRVCVKSCRAVFESVLRVVSVVSVSVCCIHTDIKMFCRVIHTCVYSHMQTHTHTHTHTLANLQISDHVCTYAHTLSSELLRCFAESTLLDMVQLLFTRLASFSEDTHNMDDTSSMDQVTIMWLSCDCMKHCCMLPWILPINSNMIFLHIYTDSDL